MSVPVFTHTDMIEHKPGEGHPERPARLATVLAALRDAALDGDLREAEEAAVEDLIRVHPPAHVDRMLGAAPDAGLNALDPDTLLSPGTVRAARLAAGAAIQAARAVAAGETDRAFAAVRPPGHHA
ncbi:MAG: histone deacetylase family protein, partial [Brevundimonas sp.]